MYIVTFLSTKWACIAASFYIIFFLTWYQSQSWKKNWEKKKIFSVEQKKNAMFSHILFSHHHFIFPLNCFFSIYIITTSRFTCFLLANISNDKYKAVVDDEITTTGNGDNGKMIPTRSFPQMNNLNPYTILSIDTPDVLLIHIKLKSDDYDQ